MRYTYRPSESSDRERDGRVYRNGNIIYEEIVNSESYCLVIAVNSEIVSICPLREERDPCCGGWRGLSDILAESWRFADDLNVCSVNQAQPDVLNHYKRLVFRVNSQCFELNAVKRHVLVGSRIAVGGKVELLGQSGGLPSSMR